MESHSTNKFCFSKQRMVADGTLSHAWLVFRLQVQNANQTDPKWYISIIIHLIFIKIKIKYLQITYCTKNILNWRKEEKLISEYLLNQSKMSCLFLCNSTRWLIWFHTLFPWTNLQMQPYALKFCLGANIKWLLHIQIFKLLSCLKTFFLTRIRR